MRAVRFIVGALVSVPAVVAQRTMRAVRFIVGALVSAPAVVAQRTTDSLACSESSETVPVPTGAVRVQGILVAGDFSLTRVLRIIVEHRIDAAAGTAERIPVSFVVPRSTPPSAAAAGGAIGAGSAEAVPVLLHEFAEAVPLPLHKFAEAVPLPRREFGAPRLDLCSAKPQGIVIADYR